MTVIKLAANGISGIALAVLAACSSTQQSTNNTTLQPISTQTGTQTMPVMNHSVGVFSAPQRPIQAANQIIYDYQRLDSTLAAVKNGDDNAAMQFLATQSDSAMGESVRNEWLKSLGRRGQSGLFAQEYARVHPDGRHQETRCYAHLFGVENNAQFVNDLLEETGKLPAGCNTLLQARASSLNPSRAWRRVRGLLSSGQSTDAANLAAALGSPLNSGSGYGTQENMLRSVISQDAQKSPDAAAARLQAMAGKLNSEQVGYAWGVLGLAHAKNQNFSTALSYYHLADRKQLNTEQFEWYARSALRSQNWQALDNIIASMPAKLQNDPTWLYWRARSLAALGNNGQARSLYQKAAQSGRNFYAVLSTEELGQRINTRNNVGDATQANVQQLSRDGAINRALTLFTNAQQSGNSRMRRQAQNEWRYAVRGMNETTLLTAAQLAYNHQFYDMAIYSADRTDHALNFNLRYLMPYRDLVVSYSQQHGVDPAWVYGLIRQESRFVIGAQSSAGAQGLMQVMPATAREIARKIGMNSSDLYTMNGNIRMGTWYMADARRNLQNNEILATAGYNAGPGRARRWQGGNMEGAIYAETIPFNETRDYVKKVMTNTVYYSSLLGGQPSLKQRMGVVPARY
ncbi:lytic transglycosylase domain-containing protein [Wielerella bovis]|uniref:lytic transglycosylase domain-containing protein n=1 Tax=Wielerella bovis TaxID=2917790 RepID=UPI002018B621|nr:lytic transglycosylase domain-containing protein [Wielerella bovis]ULJ61561.1 lytic transglycosylase domain-containing protein [Wielerella bovis]